MKKRMREMEEEASKLRDMQAAVEREMLSTTSTNPHSHSNTDASLSSAEVDSRSIYVGNVDYSTTPEELQAHFQACGTINRITIQCDKFTGNPKGFAYVEFGEQGAVGSAMALNESVFKGRVLKVVGKRMNIPGYNWRGRGRGRGGSGPRGFPRGMRSRRGAFAPY